MTGRETLFAPAKRLPHETIKSQSESLVTQNIIPDFFKLLPNIVMVLNEERQIVYTNDTLLETLGLIPQEQVLGLRPGEALSCINAAKNDWGCGTAENCSVCGAVLAILECQRTNSPVEKECLLTTSADDVEKSLELLVRAVPISVADASYTLFVVQDIGEEKRRKMYEQVFFHDLINSCGAAKGLISLLQDTADLNEVRTLSTYAGLAMDQVLEEINFQKALSAAESGSLELSLTRFSAEELIRNTVAIYEKNEDVRCTFELKIQEGVGVYSDPVLVKRVLNNMLKNAVEASGNATVEVEVIEREKHVEFLVNNKQYMPKDVQLQIFKRTFSSKGAGRGYGTYSMKLFGEKYLGGYVHFTSDQEIGTTFTLGLPV